MFSLGDVYNLRFNFKSALRFSSGRFPLFLGLTLRASLNDYPLSRSVCPTSESFWSALRRIFPISGGVCPTSRSVNLKVLFFSKTFLILQFSRCGFDGSLCDYTWIFVLIGILAFFAAIIPLAYFLYRKKKEKMLYDMTWRIPREQVRLLERDKKAVSMNSISTGSWVEGDKANMKLSAKQAIVNGVRVANKRFTQNRNLTFPKADLVRLKELKLLENDNLNKFYGMCFNQQNEMIVMWMLCQRGSLEDVLFNNDMKIGRNFQVSFAKDVVKVSRERG